MNQTTIDIVFGKIIAERLRQESLVREGKFEHTCESRELSLSQKIAVLTEELGEAAECVIEIELHKRGKKSIEDLQTELYHVAAVAVAWLERLEA